MGQCLRFIAESGRRRAPRAGSRRGRARPSALKSFQAGLRSLYRLAPALIQGPAGVNIDLTPAPASGEGVRTVLNVKHRLAMFRPPPGKSVYRSVVRYIRPSETRGLLGIYRPTTSCFPSPPHGSA